MATQPTISISDVEFDDIKDSLKNYLKSQDEFVDYDFEGAGLSILLNILAYNTHYMAYYINMLANESFLDSAQVRNSIVSHAKHINYTPQSRRAAEAVVNITVTPLAGDSPSTITIPKDQVFTASKDGTSYSFYNRSSLIITKDSDDNYISAGATITEGTPLSFIYTVNNQDPDQKFIIPENTVDTTSLIVKVIPTLNDVNDPETVYSLSTDLTTLTSTSQVYFLQEVDGGKFEVVFGDGVIGKKPANNQLILLDYMTTNGLLANNIGSADTPNTPTFSATVDAEYTFDSQAKETNDVDVEVSSASFGGAVAESNASIRFLAPKAYEAQSRSVTALDYQTNIIDAFPDAESVIAWGGEDNDPPIYGKVFVSVKPKSGVILSDAAKDDIINNVLKPKNLVTVIPEIVDPDFTYILPTIEVVYDSRLTTKTGATLVTNVTNTIKNYNNTELEKFEKTLRYSKLLKDIDDTDTAILHNRTAIKVQKRFKPDTANRATYTFKFNNAFFHIDDGCATIVSSTAFTILDNSGVAVTAYLDDDGNGNIRTYKIVKNVNTIINATAGTIDYIKGEIILSDFAPSAFVGDELKITVTPRQFDVKPASSQILIIDETDIVVSATVERDPDKDQVSGTPFPFSLQS